MGTRTHLLFIGTWLKQEHIWLMAEARTHLADKVLPSLTPRLILSDKHPVQLPTVGYGRGAQKQGEPCALR